MKPKKSKEANLESKKIIFFQIGLVMSISLVFCAFEWDSMPNYESAGLNSLTIEDYIEEQVINTFQSNEKKLAPPPSVIEDFFMVEDNYIIDEGDEFFVDNVEISQNQMISVVSFEPEESGPSIYDFVKVEEKPSFRGQGINGFCKYIAQNLRYPDEAIELFLQGTVYVEFTVSKAGEIINAVVVKGVDPLLDKEALRVVNGAEGWLPGKQRDEKVAVKFVIPVKFRLG